MQDVALDNLVNGCLDIDKIVIGCDNRNEVLLRNRSNFALNWRHKGRDGVSNHQPHDGLLNRLFRRRSKKT